MRDARAVAEKFFQKWCVGAAPDPVAFTDALEKLVKASRREATKDARKLVEAQLAADLPPVTPELLRKIFEGV